MKHETEKSIIAVTAVPSAAERPAWFRDIKKYEKPSTPRAVFQLLNTLVPYLAVLALMYLSISLGYPYWATLLLAVPAGAFLVRLFVIFHDCCHGSFLRSRRAMQVIGTALGVLVFTPFEDWRHSHGIHHSTSGNLDRRGIGDVWTMTVGEYAASSRWMRFRYRMFRNPLVMFGIGPFYTFFFSQRFPGSYANRKDKRSVLLTNLLILFIITASTFMIGLGAYLKIQIPVMFFAGVGGIWLFYVQHQFDPAYWTRSEDWDSLEAALEGCSHYRLPAILNWFSANIGIHHIHHLRPSIPNYNLQRCLDETPELQLENPLTIGKSLGSVHLNLWDEISRRLVSFREAARLLRLRGSLTRTGGREFS